MLPPRAASLPSPPCVCSFDKGDVSKGRKVVGHTLRMLVVAPQLCAQRLEDPTAGNELYKQALASDAYTVDDMREAFSGICDALLAALRELCAAAPAGAPKPARRGK